jgi:L-lactate dehydrogenase complex protein LldG
MEQTTPRENILRKIRTALRRETTMPFPEQSDAEEVFNRLAGSLAIQFETEFTRLLGKFHACPDQQAIVKQIAALAKQHGWQNCHVPQNLLSLLPELTELPFINAGPALDADAAVTDCECLLARTGTVLISSVQETGRAIPAYAPVHLIVAHNSQLLPDIRESMAYLKNKYTGGMPSMLAFSTGPSRTGDIEKTLVVGVHGPREVILFLLPD